jgi:hypothetical protein
MTSSGRTRVLVVSAALALAAGTAGVLALTGEDESPGEDMPRDVSPRSRAEGRGGAGDTPERRQGRRVGRSDPRPRGRSPTRADTPGRPAAGPPTVEERRALRREAERMIRESPTLRAAPPDVRRRLLRDIERAEEPR